MSKGKKILAATLAGCLALSTAGVTVFAAEKTEEPEVSYQSADSRTIIIPTKDFIDKYLGGEEGWARLSRFLANTVGQIVTGTYAEDMAEVLMRMYRDGIIIGNPAEMTQEEVNWMLDQIYWVYSNNPEFVSWTVDCTKMLENWVDASIHSSDPYHQKLAVYYDQWLRENCKPDFWPDEPDTSEPDTSDTTETGTSETDTTEPDTSDTGTSESDVSVPDTSAPDVTDSTEPSSDESQITTEEEPSLDDNDKDDNGNSNVSTGDAAMIGLGVVLATSAVCVAILRKKAK